MRAIYLAGPWPLREKAAEVASKLRGAGHVVTSRWIDSTDEVAPIDSAKQDLYDIDSADTLILLTGYTGPNAYTGGRHFESGYAYCLGLKLFIIGERENVFHHLPHFKVYVNVEEFMEHEE